MSLDQPIDDEDELLAGELALGLLDAPAARAASDRLSADLAFAQAHRRWQEHAAAMLDARSEPPPPSLWARLEASLPANDVGARSGRSALVRWRWATLAASLAAVVLGIVSLGERRAQNVVRVAATPPPLVALLTGASGKQVAAVSFDPSTRRLSVIPRGLDLGDRSAELWIIAPGQRPRSLGVIAIDESGSRQADTAAAGLIAAGATLAVSVEPGGGSPSGQPTGPVILSGKIGAT